MEMHDHKKIEKDELTGDKLLSGHEYDNIRELDNNLPKWWVWMFIITIVFSVVYVVIYDIVKVAPYQEEEYKNEMAAAGIPTQAQAAAAFDTNIVVLTDQPSLDAGKDIWIKQCKVCHLDGGQGLVGPNLTDNFSIHGCDYKDVVKIIVVGAPEKGMISWKAQLTDDQIKQVASYTMTLMGTNPPNPKEPQGEPCK
jgi:cytochrome c oxidase cbb3-type subunit 3